MTTQNLLRRLQNVRQTGPNQWRGDCPCHSDEPHSVAILGLKCGVTKFSCLYGHSPTHIVSHLNLLPAEIFPPGINVDQLILDIARDDRDKGYKLGEFDLALESEAFNRIRSKN